jgi:hypothetical protein
MKTKFSLVSALILVVCFIPLKNNGQDTLTNGEVYDFEVGDIFHISIASYGPSGGYFGELRNIEIIEKYFSSGGDTVYYVKNILYQGSGGFGQFIENVHYFNLETHLPSIDSIYSDPLMYNGRVVNYRSDSAATWLTIEKLVQGLGIAYEYYYDWEGDVSSTVNLIYFNKSGEEWGTPIFVGLKETQEFEKNIKIFPNPATSFITININGGQPIEEAIIYNHLGQKALVAVPVNNTVDVSTLKPGIYFVEIATKEWRERIMFIKK